MCFQFFAGVQIIIIIHGEIESRHEFESPRALVAQVVFDSQVVLNSRKLCQKSCLARHGFCRRTRRRRWIRYAEILQTWKPSKRQYHHGNTKPSPSSLPFGSLSSTPISPTIVLHIFAFNQRLVFIPGSIPPSIPAKPQPQPKP